MKITTDSQAKAVREWLDKSDELEALELLEPAPKKSHRDMLRTALAEYEQSKIELTEDEMIFLKSCALSEFRSNEISKKLHALGLLKRRDAGETWDYFATPAGRAYLEAHKPRERKWDIKVGNIVTVAGFKVTKLHEDADLILIQRGNREEQWVYIGDICEVK